MANSHYCPMCSAYITDEHLEKCPKCHTHLKEEWERREYYEKKLKRKSEIVEGPFHPVTGLTCSICGEDVEIKEVKVEEFTVNGDKIGSGPLGPLYAPNRMVIAFQSWRCRKDHRLFSSYDVEWRELCPHCLTHNNRYGTLVRSCAKCKSMVPIAYYKKDDPLKLMEKREWHYAPQLENK
jgi:hypothetical protein